MSNTPTNHIENYFSNINSSIDNSKLIDNLYWTGPSISTITKLNIESNEFTVPEITDITSVGVNRINLFVAPNASCSNYILECDGTTNQMVCTATELGGSSSSPPNIVKVGVKLDDFPNNNILLFIRKRQINNNPVDINLHTINNIVLGEIPYPDSQINFTTNGNIWLGSCSTRVYNGTATASRFPPKFSNESSIYIYSSGDMNVENTFRQACVRPLSIVGKTLADFTKFIKVQINEDYTGILYLCPE